MNLSYGYEKNEAGVFVPSRQHHGEFPLCYIPFASDLVQKTVNQLSSALFDVSNADKKLFVYFLSHIQKSLMDMVEDEEYTLEEIAATEGPRAAEMERRFREKTENSIHLFSELRKEVKSQIQ